MKTLLGLLVVVAVVIPNALLSVTSDGSPVSTGGPGTYLMFPDGSLWSNGFKVHGCFACLFTEEEYNCYGFMAYGDFETHTCGCASCGKTYYTQNFIAKNGNVHRIFGSYSECQCSNNGTFHDDLNLSEISACKMDCDLLVPYK